MKTVRLGIVGVRGMGSDHARRILGGAAPRVTLSAVCDIDPAQTAKFPQVEAFSDSRALIRSGKIDALLIATPHYAHTTIGIDALKNGLHVLVEKPISVHKADCQRLLAAHKNPKQIFGAMFNQRTTPAFNKIRSLVQSGELGEIRRLNWIITDWFRTEAYYASGGWRATWAGEGGGVLLNQAPHQLDLFQWMFGMPSKVRAHCGLGRYHKIEVEDDVTAYLEYPNGATGIFITSTGEAPGTNRLEVAGERGKLVYESGKLTFQRNEVPMSQFSRTTKAAFAAPPVWNAEIPIPPGDGGAHMEIVRNFADAILDGAELLAPASDGIRSVELANAMLLSSLQEKTISLPLNAAAFEKQLKKLAATSKGKKKVVPLATNEVANSFNQPK